MAFICVYSTFKNRIYSKNIFCRKLIYIFRLEEFSPTDRIDKDKLIFNLPCKIPKITI